RRFETPDLSYRATASRRVGVRLRSCRAAIRPRHPLRRLRASMRGCTHPEARYSFLARRPDYEVRRIAKHEAAADPETGSAAMMNAIRREPAASLKLQFRSDFVADRRQHIVEANVFLAL